MNKRFFAGQNLAEAFDGQGVQAMLELDVETAGMVDNTSKSIF